MAPASRANPDAFKNVQKNSITGTAGKSVASAADFSLLEDKFIYLRTPDSLHVWNEVKNDLGKQQRRI